jgi:aminoglycoside 6'-N-acetyltransferase I
MIRTAEDSDRLPLAAMRSSLWPDTSFEDHLRELESAPVGQLPSETFVAVGEENGLLGFIDVGLRSHADGCNPARPVGFVEGWFVREAFRRQGIGGDLMRAAETWARTQGSLEMASDTWIDHQQSQRAHQALGKWWIAAYTLGNCSKALGVAAAQTHSGEAFKCRR